MMSSEPKWFRIIISVMLLIFFNQVLLFVLHINDMFLHLYYVMINIVTIILTIVMLYVLRSTTNELENSNQKLKNIFDSLNVAVWSHDLKSGHVFINQGIEKLYGYNLKDFYQDYDLWKKVIHPDDLHILTEREQQLEQRQPVTSNYRIIRQDGDVRWIQDTGIPTYDDKGNFVNFSGVLFDITDQKEGEERYRGIVELSPDFIAVIRNWKLDFINEAGSKLLGIENSFKLFLVDQL